MAFTSDPDGGRSMDSSTASSVDEKSAVECALCWFDENGAAIKADEVPHWSNVRRRDTSENCFMVNYLEWDNGMAANVNDEIDLFSMDKD